MRIARIADLLRLARSAGATFQTTLRDESLEVVHHHQVIHGGVHAGIENRGSVLRYCEAEEHLAERTRHCRGPARGEIALLKPCLPGGLVRKLKASLPPGPI